MRGLMLINNNVEDVEALATKALLIRSGLLVETFTLEADLNIVTKYQSRVEVDYLISELSLEAYDFLILPGGPHVFNFLGKSPELNELINYFNKQNKLIAAICAAPLFLNEVNLLTNQPFTAFPGVSGKIDGQYLENKKVVKINNIITSRSAGTVYEFVFEILDTLMGSDAVNYLKKDIVF